MDILNASEILDELNEIEKNNHDFNLNIKDSLLNAIKYINGEEQISIENKQIKLYDYIAKSCASYISKDLEFGKISLKYELKKLYKILNFKTYEILIDAQYENEIISDDYYNFVKSNMQVFDFIDNNRDLKLDIFGLKTLERSYLLRENKKIKNILEDEKNQCNETVSEIIAEYTSFKNLENKYNLKKKKAKVIDNHEFELYLETPQMMWLRCAIQVHGINKNKDTIKTKLENIKETYDLMSNLYFTHATPTLFNSGRKFQQLSSCYILDCQDDLNDIGANLSKIMQISKYGGGIGINLSKIRSKESLIRSNGGEASGIIPLCRVLDKIANYANQSGLRKGSIACYLEIWHVDIEDFIEMRRNIGNENMKARDLFFGVWTCDLFMHAVKNNDYWYLMSPNEAPGLNDVYGEEFNKLYYKYVMEGKYHKKILAGDLMKTIIECLHETGMPYVLFKDNINNQSNQKNIGIIRSSNLCTEIVEHTSGDEIAVCNLASISLPKFVNDDGTFNYKKLGEVTRVVIKNLNIIIDENFYPTKETKNSNFKHRPIGLGVQGLADTYIKMNVSFESLDAFEINKKIFETIYYYSLFESNELAKKYGAYSTFNGSPFSEGKMQFHLWGKSFDDMNKEFKYDWKGLCESIIKYGTINSLTTTIMPTASTAQIMGNNESIEPFASNIYVRKTLSGDFLVVNKHLINDLKALNMWNNSIYSELLFDKGSVKNLNIPQNLKNKYKTAYEIKQSVIIKQATDRGIFIDQSQSLNLFTAESSIPKIFTCLMKGWENKLKTGIYYLRTTPSSDAEKFAIDIEEIEKIKLKRNISEDELNNDKKTQQTQIDECLLCSA
jgi:ribonucleoside-diphosphate reductase alpha chain